MFSIESYAFFYPLILWVLYIWTYFQIYRGLVNREKFQKRMQPHQSSHTINRVRFNSLKFYPSKPFFLQKFIRKKYFICDCIHSAMSTFRAYRKYTDLMVKTAWNSILIEHEKVFSTRFAVTQNSFLVWALLHIIIYMSFIHDAAL